MQSGFEQRKDKSVNRFKRGIIGYRRELVANIEITTLLTGVCFTVIIIGIYDMFVQTDKAN